MINDAQSIDKLKKIAEFEASEEFLNDLKRYGQIRTRGYSV
jgi:hypothetical protein